MSKWIGVDLDGTLARYDGWKGAGRIGEPIPLMVNRVKAWLAEGRQVRIFTARVADPDPAAVPAIQAWCREHLGTVLPVTNVKDFDMEALWDDRAIQVEKNTGQRVPPEVGLVYTLNHPHAFRLNISLDGKDADGWEVSPALGVLRDYEGFGRPRELRGKVVVTCRECKGSCRWPPDAPALTPLTLPEAP